MAKYYIASCVFTAKFPELSPPGLPWPSGYNTGLLALPRPERGAGCCTQPVRNPKLAPKHYVTGAEGKFVPHTPEEQKQIMEEYCKSYTTSTVICYCHYCLEGLQLGKVKGIHIAEMLFPPDGDR